MESCTEVKEEGLRRRATEDGLSLNGEAREGQALGTDRTRFRSPQNQRPWPSVSASSFVKERDNVYLTGWSQTLTETSGVLACHPTH